MAPVLENTHEKLTLTQDHCIQADQSSNNKLLLPIQAMYPRKLELHEFSVKQSSAVFEDIEQAITHCKDAQEVYSKMKVADRKRIIASIRAKALEFAEDFAMSAWSETGRGRYEDKLTKQRLAAESTPGPEDLQPKSFTGDNGMTLIDYAPYGVVGAVTPVTNPTATVINNSITCLSGGNGIVFNPHPGARSCTNRAVAVMNQAVEEAGGPAALVASVREPTIQSGQIMMKHPDVAVNLITGGPAVVKVALASGKKSFCAGPGNPPVVVDETADLPRAARGIYNGASFDNNMICSDEKEVFVVEGVADGLIKELKSVGAYLATPEEVARLVDVIFVKNVGEFTHAEVERDLVGMDATVLLEKIGVTNVPSTCKLIIADVNEGHPLVWTEQLMPIMPIVRMKTFDDALALAYKAEYNFKHTSSIYSSNLDRVTKMANKMNTSLFIVNGSHTSGLASGGEGYTSFSIAGTTGEGMTKPGTFVRERRLVCVNALRIV